MDEIAIIADAGLVEAIMNVVMEIGGVSIRRILVARQVQLRDAGDILHEDRGQRNGHLAGIEFRQRVVPDVKIPQRLEYALAAERGRGAQNAGEDAGLVAYDGLVTFADTACVLIGRS